ncbi:MAG: fluoride efflux transporter CrcB, partial [Pyrinomonadaceae bacterium]|nr:fluoride efflux transporter CrcB [Phycisphaerales bacterium]
MLTYLLIFLSSGLGGVLRYWLGHLIQKWWGLNFPLGTLLINVAGCLGIGFFATAFSSWLVVREEYRLAVLVGIFGGFTTFSSFGHETINLVRDGELIRAGLYVTLSVVGGLLAVYLGSSLASQLFVSRAM